MHKFKPGTLTVETVKNNFKGTIERFVPSENLFSFMSSVKGTPAYWKQFLYDVVVMIKQLGIPTHFLAFSCADLRWEELPYIINILKNLGLSDAELKNLRYQERFIYRFSMNQIFKMKKPILTLLKKQVHSY